MLHGELRVLRLQRVESVVSAHSVTLLEVVRVGAEDLVKVDHRLHPFRIAQRAHNADILQLEVRRRIVFHGGYQLIRPHLVNFADLRCSLQADLLEEA